MGVFQNITIIMYYFAPHFLTMFLQILLVSTNSSPFLTRKYINYGDITRCLTTSQVRTICIVSNCSPITNYSNEPHMHLCGHKNVNFSRIDMLKRNREIQEGGFISTPEEDKGFTNIFFINMVLSFIFFFKS